MNILKTINKYINFILSPPFCRFCKIFLKDYEVFCASCISRIKNIASYSLKIDKDNNIFVHAISDYKEPLKSLILAKNSSDYSACIDLARLIFKLSILKNIDFDFFVPVPSHWTRYAYRGYNQAEVIANELGKLTGKPTINCLKRYKKTVFQAELSGVERTKNVSDAFILKNKYSSLIMGKKIVIIDDLMTTGSTIIASSKILIKYKATKVNAIVACRVC